MIYFPADLTPVPHCPGYFWDMQKERLFSLKMGGVLRELKMLRAHPAMFRYGNSRWLNLDVGDKYYRISVDGKNRYLPVASLKRLEMVHYHIPVIERVEYETES